MMNLVMKSLNRLHQDESGQGLVEYLLILALVAFAATAGMKNLATDQHHSRPVHHVVTWSMMHKVPASHVDRRSLVDAGYRQTEPDPTDLWSSQ